jgi:YfiH family protein
MILTSPLLSRIAGLQHGFGTRLGGVSGGRFASLNAGRGLGDADAAVEANLARLLALAVPDAEALFVLEQVHGTEVVEASSEARHPPRADGALTGARGLALAIRTADCAPILIAALDERASARAVAAVHAGWRGATAGILRRAVAELGERGFAPSALRVAIGPTIGIEAFEVGEEVIAAARASLEGREPPLLRAGDNREKLHLDLVGLLAAQLVALGVPPAYVERVGGCTVSSPALYYSHRRDGRGEGTGRQLSLIALQRAGGQTE